MTKAESHPLVIVLERAAKFHERNPREIEKVATELSRRVFAFEVTGHAELAEQLTAAVAIISEAASFLYLQLEAERLKNAAPEPKP